MQCREHAGGLNPGYSCILPWCLSSFADGLFGQCQVGSTQDRSYFQVTSPVLQRLQDVLRHLMAQGEGEEHEWRVTAARWEGVSTQHYLVALWLSEVLLVQGIGWTEEGSS